MRKSFYEIFVSMLVTILVLFVIGVMPVTAAPGQRPVYVKTGADYCGAITGGVTETAISLGAEVYKTVITCNDTPASITYVNGGTGTNNVGGVQIYDFPEGRILVLGVTVEDMTVAPLGNGFTGADGGDFGFGTTTAAGNNLETTEVNFCPATSIDGVTNVTDSALAASAQFDGTTTPVNLFANFQVDPSDITNDVSLTFDATVTITWVNMGDY